MIKRCKYWKKRPFRDEIQNGTSSHFPLFPYFFIFKRKYFFSLFFAGMFLYSVSAQQNYTADWASIDSRPVPQWFTDAKFGIFIHWGLYSVPAWAPILPGFGNETFSEWYWYWLTDKRPLYVDFHNKTYGENFK